MLVDVLEVGIDLVQGVHGVDGYVGSEGGVGGKVPPPSVDLCLNPSDSTRDKAELGLPPAVSGSLLPSTRDRCCCAPAHKQVFNILIM